MKKIIRVFPCRTSYTPVDDYVFIGMPPGLIIPEHDEVHVSCTFSWDKALCRDLAAQWEMVTDKPVKLGGVAFGSPVEGFVPGTYLKSNIIFTSRGCNNSCGFCIVPKLEGKLVELPIVPGNIIQDNNFLQCSRAHKDKVFDMLRTQSGICFKGGLQSDLIDGHFVENITSLRIKELWLACDSDGELPALKKACEKLHRAGIVQRKIHVYAISYGRDMAKDYARARAIYEAGAMPFVQLFQEYAETKTTYPTEWVRFARVLKRPAAYRAHFASGGDYKDLINFSR